MPSPSSSFACERWQKLASDVVNYYSWKLLERDNSSRVLHWGIVSSHGFFAFGVLHRCDSLTVHSYQSAPQFKY